MHALPEALAPMAAYRQFIVYTIVPHPTKPGKTNKFPCDFRTGRVVSAHDSDIWTDAGTAIAAAAQLNAQGGPHPFGVGFTLTHADPFWFLDIDGAYDGQAWSPLATALCQAFPGAAIEVSSSGRGLHIFGTGHVPPHKTKNSALGLEFYNSGRFVALTGTNAVGSDRLLALAAVPGRTVLQARQRRQCRRRGRMDGWAL
jgi:primase-polymerase (primpol)-like protein